MVKRKHLILILSTTFYTNNILASAWLPKAGGYKYSFSMSVVDNKSRMQKQERANLYLKAQQEIEYLSEVIKDLNTSSVRYKSVYNRIQLLKKALTQLTSYQDDESKSAFVEYGINNKQSIGLHIQYKTNIFLDEYVNSTSNTSSADIFYKFKLFQNNNFIVSLQPKVSVTKDTSLKEELFNEISFLVGSSKEFKRAEMFTDTSLSFGKCINCATTKKQYYSFAISEGMKFPYGFMLVNFTKYYFRRNYGPIYNKTLYEQFSVAKEIKFGTLKQRNCTMQRGYFWDTSIIHPHYKVSGTIFSVWLDV